MTEITKNLCQITRKYLGEIISGAESEIRAENDTYFFEFNKNAENEEYSIIDSNYLGNFTRFFNHECEPNIFSIKVYNGHSNIDFPEIWFFALTDIEKNNELGFDYQGRSSVRNSTLALSRGKSVERVWKESGKSVERVWKERGKNVERAWKECGKSVERAWKEREKSVEIAWKERGKSMERAWKERGKSVERAQKERGKSVKRACKERRKSVEKITGKQRGKSVKRV